MLNTEKTSLLPAILSASNSMPLKKRIRFTAKSLIYGSEISFFLKKLHKHEALIREDSLRAIDWPYVHNEWSVKTKLSVIASHYEVLSESNLKFLPNSSYTICNLNNISKGVTVKIDSPKWFIREGELTINVFLGELRVASIAFVLSKHEGERVAYIGAIQGIHSGIPSEESLGIYKKLSKDFFGLRPRSLLLEVLKVILTQLEIKKMLCISEQNRHHRHSYFGNDTDTKFKNEYNPLWEEHGGQALNDRGFYDVPLEPAIRDITLIKSNKRAQYRRRNELVNDLKTVVNFDSFETIVP